MSSSPSSSSSSSPSSLSLTVDSTRNRLAIPGLVGDPFLSFDVDVQAGYCVTGTAIGAVALWRLDHVADIILTASDEAEPAAGAPAPAPAAPPAVVSEVATDEVVCRMLANTSDEGIRHVFIQDEQVFAVVGDVQVKIWGSWHDPTSQVKKFDRVHDYKTCKETFTLRHEMKLLVMTLNQEQAVMLDLETMMHTPFTLPIPNNATPMYFDGHYLILLELTDEGIKLVHVIELQTQRLVHTLILERAHKFYWGFQLESHSAPSSTVVPASASSSDEQKSASTTMSASSVASSSASAASSLGVASSRLLLSYISNHHFVKCVPLASIPLGFTQVDLRRGIPRERPRTRQLVTHRIEAASGTARILAYLYDPPSRTFLTLNSDAKIKIFSLDPPTDAGDHAAGKSPGHLVKKYRHIAGSFKLGYPYIIRKVGEKMIFYTADEGVYVLRLE